MCGQLNLITVDFFQHHVQNLKYIPEKPTKFGLQAFNESLFECF